MTATKRLKLVTAVQAALWLNSTYSAGIHPDRIRQWSARNQLARYGSFRKAKLDLDEVVAYANSKGLLDRQA